MTSAIFLDANIPFYSGGAPHTFRQPCIEVLQLVSERPRAFWTDAEVLQELLHRYLAINRWPQGKQVFEEFAGLMRGRIEPILARDVERAAGMTGQWPGLAARDLIQLAVMDRVGSDTLVSADRDFDRVTGIQRRDPADLPQWRNLVEL